MSGRLLRLTLLFSLSCPMAWAQNPQGAEFQVNSYTTNGEGQPTVANDANGNFVVVWHSSGQDGSTSGVFGQRFNGSGIPQGSEFQVNSYTTGDQANPAVAWDGSTFLVVWPSLGQDGNSYGVFGQRFSAAGIPQGSEFQVNSYTTGAQQAPAVVSDANGNFVVVWGSDLQDGSGVGVFGQRFSAAGIPQGSEFQVNSYTTGTQQAPAVAWHRNGDFVVAWESNGQDGSDFGVFGQRYRVLPSFTDDPLQSSTTLVKVVHFTELRQAIDVLRARAGLAAASWTDPTLTAGAIPVKAVHLTELRTALDAVYVAASQTAPTYTHATVTGGATVITAVDVAELRAAVLAIWLV